jgi:hypothetical protein
MPIKGGTRALFYENLKHSNIHKFGAKLPFKFQYLEPNQTSFLTTYQVFFTMAANPVVLSISESDISSMEESLINRYFDIFDTETMVSPVSMSKENLLNNIVSRIPFIEEDQASFTPYVIETYFPFPEFVSQCEERYSQGERVILNKLGS